LNIIAI